MSSGPRIRVTALEMERIAHELDAQPGRIAIATRRALREATTYANRALEDALPKATGIRLKFFKGRMRMEIRSDEGIVWIGLNPFEANRFQRKQIGGGVEAEGAKFPGAFIAKVSDAIWERDYSGIVCGRKGSGKVTPQFVEQIEGRAMHRKASPRLPIQNAILDFSKKAKSAIEETATAVETFFMLEFERNLRK